MTCPYYNLLLLLLSHFSRIRFCATPWTAAYQASPSPDSPGKNTGVGCHFLLQCMKVESESEVAQSCLTLSDPMGCSLPGSSIHGIFRATVLEWGAIACQMPDILLHVKENGKEKKASLVMSVPRPECNRCLRMTRAQPLFAQPQCFRCPH